MLIKHSKTFLEKQAVRLAEKQVMLEKLDQENKKIASKLTELKKKKAKLYQMLDEPIEPQVKKPAERLPETIQDLELGRIDIPYFTLEESKLLFEITRFVRRNISDFSKFQQREVNPFREIEPIQTLIQYQIQILKDLKTLSLVGFKERYSTREINKKLKELKSMRKEN